MLTTATLCVRILYVEKTDYISWKSSARPRMYFETSDKKEMTVYDSQPKRTYVFVKEWPKSQSNSTGWKNITGDYIFTDGEYGAVKCLYSGTDHSDFNNTWIKIIGSSLTLPNYVYTGSEGDSKYNFMTKNGTSKDSVVISSSAPVFIQTIRTDKPYEECSKWAPSFWEWFGYEVDGDFMDFDSPDSQKYTIDEQAYYNIKNDYCYVIVAHFADGETVVSEVMQK